MGSSNSHSAYNKKQLRNTHPNQQKSVLVEQGDKHYIQSSFRMDEKHYNHWRSGVESVSKTPYNSFLYLPQDMGYVKNDKLCGNSVGYAVVQFISFRSTTLNIPFFFLTKQPEKNSIIHTSRKKSFTICFMPQLLPKIKLKKEKNLLEILDRRMYSSAMMKKLESHAFTLSLMNRKRTKSWLTPIVPAIRYLWLLKT